MKRLYIVAVSLLLGAFAIVATPQSHAHDNGFGRGLLGTWLVTTKFKAPNGAVLFEFSEFAAFSEGGTYIGTFALDRNGANPAAPPPFQVDFSTKFGSWKPKVGVRNQYELVLKEYLFAGTRTPADLYGAIAFPGQNVGVATVKLPALTLSPDGEKLTGDFTVNFFAPNGPNNGNIFSGGGSVEAVRLKN
ncbi:MAG: hypothetical protein N2444_08555 [Methylocystis sp.]|nr:hypothetical protein [Methylocystis sp.]